LHDLETVLLDLAKVSYIFVFRIIIN